MPIASTDNMELNYRIDGDEGLPWLTLSNGLGLDLTMWDPQIPALSGKYRVLRYDTRGHGTSDTPAEPFAIEHLGRDVLALLDRLGVARTHLCGFSMGGLIGIWLGIHAPQRLNKLVLAHTAALIGLRSTWNERIDIVNAKGMQAVSGAAMQRWFTAGFIASQPDVVSAMKASMERTSAAGYVRCCAAIRDADFREGIVRITAPTMILAGTQDIATTPADARFLAQRIASSSLVEIDSAHLSNVEKPREFSEALHAFLGAAHE